MGSVIKWTMFMLRSDHFFFSNQSLLQSNKTPTTCPIMGLDNGLYSRPIPADSNRLLPHAVYTPLISQIEEGTTAFSTI
jgi:hypothetical protein